MLWQRHSDLAKEMLRRGYNHNSEMTEEECGCIYDLSEEKVFWEIDKKKALKDLLDRCPECHSRFTRLTGCRSS